MTGQRDKPCRKGKAGAEVPQEFQESQVSQYKKSVPSHKGNTLTLLVYLDICYGFTFGMFIWLTTFQTT